jgi:phage terminase large subunit-like protein
MTTATAIEIKAPEFHTGQAEVRKSKARYKVLTCGRRWGKSVLGAWQVIEAPLTGKGDGWWVWPTTVQGRSGWRKLRSIGSQLATRIPGVRIMETEKTIRFPNGYEARLRSADNPDSLRGDGPAVVVLDEASLMPERVWGEILRPSLTDKAGEAVFVFTPKGMEWTHQLYQRGLDPSQTDWASWNFSTLENPTLPAQELEQMQKDYAEGRIPERVWRQEILAEFLSDEGAVFRRIHAAATSEETPAVPGRGYVIGVDLAKMADFTCLSVWDVLEKRQVKQDRFNEIDYIFQEQRIASLAAEYNNATLVVETNSTGEAMCERLERRGLRVVRFTTTQGSKAEAVEAFSIAIENAEAKILGDEVLIGEMMAYERTRRANNRMSYSHPDGGHDDCVDAAWLAWTELDAGASVGWLAA